MKFCPFCKYQIIEPSYIQIGLFSAVIMLLLIFTPDFAVSQSVINDPTEPCSINLMNSKNNNCLFLTDSLNQLKLNSNVRTDIFEVKKDNIELYSLFDGNYNFRFIFPYLDSSNISNLYHQNRSNYDKLNYQTIVNLFSGTNNGNLRFDFRGNYKSFYWLLQPYFEISDGVLFPSDNNTVLNQKALTSSGYQNILNHTEFGIINSRSSLIFDFNLNISELYIPKNIYDISNIKYKFNDYNQFLAIIKFSNSFSEDMKIKGNVFFMDSFRDVSPSNDTSANILKSSYLFNLEEFYYGMNLITYYNLISSSNPITISLDYKQNLFLFDNYFVAGRQRIETEALDWKIEQQLEFRKNLINAKVVYKSKAVLLSTLGNLPKNLNTFDVFFSNDHSINTKLTLNNAIKYTTFVPMVSYYYALSQNSIENLNLKPETWIESTNSIFYKLDTNFYYSLKVNFFLGKDIILQVFDDKDLCQYQNFAEKYGAEFGIDFNYSNQNFGIKWNANYTFQNFTKSQLSIAEGIRIPKFQTKLSYSQNIFNFMNFQIELEYINGISYYNSTKNMIETANLPILLNIILQKQFDNSLIFVILKNISNQYYEINYGLPESGLSINLGTIIKF